MKIINSRKALLHIELIVIRIKGLSKQGLRTKTLVLIYDGCWKNDMKKTIIVGKEVNINENNGLLYCAPNILKNTKDLKNFKIRIQIKEYDNYIGDNLVLSVAIIGKLTNSTETQYKINIEGIIQSLSSKKI